jgi:radical SAM superfamily enzyme YgiQ (UPF0313 family)
MRITFIRPNLRDARSSDAMEPLSFAILKGLTPPDVETKLYDQRLESIPYDEPTDLAALTVETYTARQSYRIAEQYRRRGVKVVMGGYHPTLAPEEALRFADSIVRGDAEGVWGRVVADARAGRLGPTYGSDGFPSIERSRPDRTIFEGKSYLPIGLVQYGRGCRYNCEFCSIRAFYGANLRQRPVPAVVEEIERLGRKHVFFADDNIFVDVPRAKELFRALTPLRILWSCQASIDIAHDRELVDVMARSGCTSVLIGFESLNEENLRQMRKRWNLMFGDYSTSIEILRDAGLMICGTFVFGYDHDTVDSFDAAVEFSIRHKFCLANFNPLTPTPGAPLYDRLRRENRLIHDRWWLEPGYRYGEATFHPRGMTADELTEGCYRARRAFNTFGSIAGRLIDLRANLRSPRRAFIYAVSNLVSRKEIQAKQGVALGSVAGSEPVAGQA